MNVACRIWGDDANRHNVKTLSFSLFFFFLPPHLPKLLVAPSAKCHTERLLICVFGWSRHAKRERRCDNRPHWLRICRCGTLLLLLWGKCIREGRTIQSSVLRRLLKFIYYIFSMFHKTEWKANGETVHFIFIFIFVLLLSNGGTMVRH